MIMSETRHHHACECQVLLPQPWQIVHCSWHFSFEDNLGPPSVAETPGIQYRAIDLAGDFRPEVHSVYMVAESTLHSN